MSNNNNFEVSTDQELRELIQQTQDKWPIVLDSTQLKQRAELYKALGDETRLKIVGMLSMGDLCLCEMISALQSPASTINHHLKILERGNLINYRKEGKFTIYSLRPEIISQLRFFLNIQHD